MNNLPDIWKDGEVNSQTEKLELKYNAIMDLEKGKTNEVVAQLLGVPANTISAWKKSKDKTLQTLKVENCDQANKAALKWFKSLRS